MLVTGSDTQACASASGCFKFKIPPGRTGSDSGGVVTLEFDRRVDFDRRVRRAFKFAEVEAPLVVMLMLPSTTLNVFGAFGAGPWLPLILT